MTILLKTHLLRRFLLTKGAGPARADKALLDRAEARAHNGPMKARPINSPSSLTVAAVLLVTLITIGAQPAFQPGVTFPMIGVASGETARLNAVNLGTSSSTSSSSCGVTFAFVDAQGQMLASKVVNLAPGQAALLELSRSQLPGDDPRREIRAVLLFGYSGGAPPTTDILQRFDCAIVPSLEVYDDKSGRTSYVLTHTQALPGPPTPAQ